MAAPTVSVEFFQPVPGEEIAACLRPGSVVVVA